MSSMLDGKTRVLLGFLKDVATLRRARRPAYDRDSDFVLWFGNLPQDHPAVRCPFFTEDLRDAGDVWLEVAKPGKKPERPPLPRVLEGWVPAEELDDPSKAPELLPKAGSAMKGIDRDEGPESDGTPSSPSKDHPAHYAEIEEAWLHYLIDQWEPWAAKANQWQQAQRAYERVDAMWRRFEEAEERYELLLGVGLLVWRDPTGTIVRRHVLTAPAEISFDAARGLFTVGPAASFDTFRVVLDMLDLQHQPQFPDADKSDLELALEEMDVRAWQRPLVEKVLRIVANRASASAQVQIDNLYPPTSADGTFRIVYAPALILQQRRSQAYFDLVSQFHDAADRGQLGRIPGPWIRLIAEGQSPDSTDILDDRPDEDGDRAHDSRLYFPLLTNDEQRQIAYRLQAQPYVLVKGPPGTGKSHTIANLVSHLLARGERVLVTAHTAKALDVLIEKLPSDIASLCVLALGTSKEEQDRLQSSVQRIIGRKDQWQGRQWAEDQIRQLEEQLTKLERRAALVDRQLREIREAENFPHDCGGGYVGTRAEIARLADSRRSQFSWFPPDVEPQGAFPLDPEELEFLAEWHSRLTAEFKRELQQDIGDVDFPTPDEFRHALERLRNAEASWEAVRQRVGDPLQEHFRPVERAALEACAEFLRTLEITALRSARVLGEELTQRILGDWLVGGGEVWLRVLQEVSDTLTVLQECVPLLGTSTVEISDQSASTRLLADITRRIEHLEQGRWPGFGIVAPRVMRETRYIEQTCRVDGKAPNDIHGLKKVRASLQFEVHWSRFRGLWPTDLAPQAGDSPQARLHQATAWVQELRTIYDLFQGRAEDSLSPLPPAVRPGLAIPKQRAGGLATLEAELVWRDVQDARRPLQEWESALNAILSAGQGHECLEHMVAAVVERDPGQWATGWSLRQKLKALKEQHTRYCNLVDRLDHDCPGLKTLIREVEGQPEWKERLLALDEAWPWSRARAWVLRTSDSDAYVRLHQERHRLEDEQRSTVEQLTTLKAWAAFFERLDDRTAANLRSWVQAIRRVGKNTGRYASRHRRAAQRYLQECLPAIPAWIMPIHRVWDTVQPVPGMFDTIIVDEASQAGVESLLLFLLGKRIVVVGDDMQNSPEAVGVSEDDIARIARKHLQDFHFRDEFRPDTSLYDHAHRAFGNLISLREHFRCVPEIIQFSNELCYREAPLIPLRQAPPNRLQPLRAVFVSDGSCEGEGQRIINRSEADAIVSKIQECLRDEAYAGKSMGVIVLQGHAQADLIASKLAAVIDPKAREERKLRCGVPAAFQGDERDVIFLSMVVAPNHRYRALTTLPEQRRFNVAVSRARDQVWLFHSVEAHELSRDDLRWRLLNHVVNGGHTGLSEVYEELVRLESEAQRRPRQAGQQPKPYESWFEVDVAVELLKRHFRIRPQVEVAGYRIDLVIEDVTNRRLAVECDGEPWHGPDQWDRDQARQRQLERAGWKFERVRESEFYADRDSVIQRIADRCKELGIRPRSPAVEPAGVVDDPASDEPAADTTSRPWSVPGSKSVEQDPPPPVTDTRPLVVERRDPDLPRENGLNFPDPRTAPRPAVEEALRLIIEHEGPLTKRLLFRRYVENCPDVDRAGKAVKHGLNRAFYSLQRSGAIVIENELGDRSLESQVVRIAGAPHVQVRPAGNRELQEIPPSEIFMVLDQLGARPAHDDETLARIILAHYGFQRLTAARMEHCARLLKVWRSRNP